jgi:hypothetical protein
MLWRWVYTVPLRLRSLFRRSQVEAELDEELRFHLEQPPFSGGLCDPPLGHCSICAPLHFPLPRDPSSIAV